MLTIEESIAMIQTDYEKYHETVKVHTVFTLYELWMIHIKNLVLIMLPSLTPVLLERL